MSASTGNFGHLGSERSTTPVHCRPLRFHAILSGRSPRPDLSGEMQELAPLLWHRLLGGQCLSPADYVTVTGPTGEAVAAGCC